MKEHKWQTKLRQPFPWRCKCGYVAENGEQVAAHKVIYAKALKGDGNGN